MEKRLYRSNKDRIIFGVAGGLADYFEIDPTLVRLVFIVLTIWSGVGVILYILGAVAIPELEETKTETKGGKTKTEKTGSEIGQKVESATKQVSENLKNRLTGEQIAGLIILFIGLIFLGEMLFPTFEFGRLWPLILVAIGFVMVAGSLRSKK